MLKDKVVVIAGGKGLIGKEFIRTIYNNNGVGIIADVNSSSMDKLEKHSSMKNIYECHLDIASIDSMVNLINLIDKKFGRINALVNCAYPRTANWGKRNFFDLDYNDLSENLSLQLGGTILLTQEFSRYFKIQNYGNIILMSSIMGIYAPKFDNYKDTNMISPIEYSVIKAGIVHLVKYLAKYLKNTNIRVNSIAPGGIFDNQPEVFLNAYKKCCVSKGMLGAEDLNGTLLYLLSEMSSFVTGQTLIVDDGWGI